MFDSAAVSPVLIGFICIGSGWAVFLVVWSPKSGLLLYGVFWLVFAGSVCPEFDNVLSDYPGTLWLSLSGTFYWKYAGLFVDDPVGTVCSEWSSVECVCSWLVVFG